MTRALPFLLGAVEGLSGIRSCWSRVALVNEKRKHCFSDNNGLIASIYHTALDAKLVELLNAGEGISLSFALNTMRPMKLARTKWFSTKVMHCSHLLINKLTHYMSGENIFIKWCTTRNNSIA